MPFGFGIRDLVVNDGAGYPLNFYGGSNTAADSTKMNVQGFLDVTYANIVDVTTHAAKAETVQTETILNTDLTITAPAAANTIVRFDFDLRVTGRNNEAEFGRDLMVPGKVTSFQVVTNPADTDVIILAKLANAIIDWDFIARSEEAFIAVDTGATTGVTDPTTGRYTSVTSLKLTGKDSDHAWTTAVLGTDRLPSEVVTGYDPTIDTVADNGRGTAEWIYSSVRIRTQASERPWGNKTDQLYVGDVNGDALYHSISWEDRHERDEHELGIAVPGEIHSSKQRYEIWVKENAGNTAYLTDLLTFMLKVSADNTGTGSNGTAAVKADDTDALGGGKTIDDATITGAEVITLIGDVIT